MLNKIEAYKNTGVVPQKITIECSNTSISISTFNKIVEKIFEGVNSTDTMNPYNTYNIKTYNMDLDGEVIDEDEMDFLLNFQISFCEASDLNTTYVFEVQGFEIYGEEDFENLVEYLTEEIGTGVSAHFVYNKNYPNGTTLEDCPPIIITDAKFTLYPNGD